jgi:L-alanine-DL-glutamate epimerase-like enolase superfamily enzyme
MSKTQIRELRFHVLAIPFNVVFRHASAARGETSSIWIEAVSESGSRSHGESCPRPYVTGETIETTRAFVSKHEASLREHVGDLASLRTWMDGRREELDRNPAAWCAVELAILDLLSVISGEPIEAFLALPRLSGAFQYSAVLGDMGPDAFRATAERYREQGFADFKVKLSGSLERDREKLALLRRWPEVRVRVDANNLWRTADEALTFLLALDHPLFAVEEPIGAGEYAQLARIAEGLGCRVILDESFLRASQITELARNPDAWLINLRVSKMGGLLRSLEVVEAARAAGVGLVVGAQVGETSLLTRAALTVAHACRDILVAQEGAFGTRLLERDVCDPPLMFGSGGVLDVAAYPSLEGPGFGLPASFRAPLC